MSAVTWSDADVSTVLLPDTRSWIWNYAGVSNVFYVVEFTDLEEEFTSAAACRRVVTRWPLTCPVCVVCSLVDCRFICHSHSHHIVHLLTYTFLTFHLLLKHLNKAKTYVDYYEQGHFTVFIKYFELVKASSSLCCKCAFHCDFLLS